MLKLVVCLALVAAAPAAQGLSRHARMVGGDTVTDRTWSFQVAIRPTRTQNSVAVKLPPCTGVLIEGATTTTPGSGTAPATSTTQYYVLTSATCVQSGTSLQLFAGIENNKITAATAPTETVAATAAIINEDYFRGQNIGDLALIPVTTIQPDSNTITAAKLVHIDDLTKSYLASSVKMAGWGYPNDKYNQQAPTLRSLSSRVVPNVYCAVLHIGKPINENHICTGGLFNKGPCTGDSGAPLVLEDSTRGTRVIGLATLTPTNGCSKGRPGVFTRVSSYLDWIAEVTGYDVEQ